MEGRGDYTGKESERLREIHADELRIRSGQIGLVNQPEPVEEPDVVYGLDGEPLAAGYTHWWRAIPPHLPPRISLSKA